MMININYCFLHNYSLWQPNHDKVYTYSEESLVHCLFDVSISMALVCTKGSHLWHQRASVWHHNEVAHGEWWEMYRWTVCFCAFIIVYVWLKHINSHKAGYNMELTIVWSSSPMTHTDSSMLHKHMVRVISIHLSWQGLPFISW